MDIETLIRKILRKSVRVGFCIFAWALSGGGYFWPIWIILLYSFEILMDAYKSGFWSEETVKAPVEDLVRTLSKKLRPQYETNAADVEDVKETQATQE